MTKRAAHYTRHPHVIAGAAQPRITRQHLTRDEYAARYRPLSDVEAPPGSIIELVFIDGQQTAMRVILPTVAVIQGGLHTPQDALPLS